MRSALVAHYRPSPGQLAFHQDRGKVRERALLCGTGAGKTYAAAYECFEITLKERPSVVLAAAPDYPQLDLSIYSTLKRMFGVHDLHALEPWATFKATEKTLRWWNGWEWRFAGLNDPTSVEGVPEASVVWLTEARLVRDFAGPDGAYLNLTRRLRGQLETARHAIIDTHSATKGILDTFKPRHVERYELSGGRLEVADCEDPDRRVYQWGTRDAIAWRTLSKTDGDRILRAYTGPAALRILEGRYAKQEGLVFEDYDEVRNLRSLPVTMNVERWTGGIDWGWDCTVLTLHAWTGSRVWTVAERVIKHAGLGEIAAAMQDLETRAGAPVKWWGGHDRPDTAHELRHVELDGVESTFDVEAMKPQKVMDGVGILQTRLRTAEWLIDPSCTQLREDLANYVMHKDRDEPDKKAYDAHAADSARYGICGGPRLEPGGTW